MPISLAERSKARVCGTLLVEVADSNPAGGYEYLCCVFFTVRIKSEDNHEKEVRLKHKAIKKNSVSFVLCADR
jgi:hypothetical protein